MRALQLGDDPVEVEVLGVDQPSPRRGVAEHLGRDEGAGIDAHRAGRDQPLRAEREQIGCARAGADEMHRHDGFAA